MTDEDDPTYLRLNVGQSEQPLGMRRKKHRNSHSSKEGLFCELWYEKKSRKVEFYKLGQRSSKKDGLWLNIVEMF
ncbi:hypothetical protein SCUP515_12022 [Seiridium cupressi]